MARRRKYGTGHGMKPWPTSQRTNIGVHAQVAAWLEERPDHRLVPVERPARGDQPPVVEYLLEVRLPSGDWSEQGRFRTVHEFARAQGLG